MSFVFMPTRKLVQMTSAEPSPHSSADHRRDMIVVLRNEAAYLLMSVTQDAARKQLQFAIAGNLLAKQYESWPPRMLRRTIQLTKIPWVARRRA